MREELAHYATGKLDPRVVDWILLRLHYVNGNFDDPATYAKLQEKLAHVDREHGTKGNYLYYLATAPNFFGPIVDKLNGLGLTREEDGGGWRRVIVEKPFGHDLKTSRELNHELRKGLTEEQIYRIDHYLGKETVQNIMVFRFGNCMFEPIWNRRYIDNVQITVAESVGVEGRGGYYDTAGCLRDMVPNHLLQLLALVAMEPPTSFEAEAVREEKSKVLRAIQPMTHERVLTNAVRGRAHRGIERARLSSRGSRQPRVEHRDLRGHEAQRRQLALGRCAVLSADRQAHEEARVRDLDPVPPPAHAALPQYAGGHDFAQRARDPRAA
jgi:glucose-6-phosphate 1-dehydrogenase